MVGEVCFVCLVDRGTGFVPWGLVLISCTGTGFYLYPEIGLTPVVGIICRNTGTKRRVPKDPPLRPLPHLKLSDT